MYGRGVGDNGPQRLFFLDSLDDLARNLRISLGTSAQILDVVGAVGDSFLGHTEQ